MDRDAPGRATGRGVTRRALFGGGAAVGALMPTAFAGQGPADDGGAWLIGTLSAHVGDRSFSLSPVGRPADRVLVTLAEGATLLRDGPASLSSFGPGEEIGVAGAWRGDTYVASTVESTYRLVIGEVTGRRGDVLATTDGEVELIPTTRARGGAAPDGGEMLAEPLDSVAPGDRIVVLGRRDPRTGRLLAGDLGVRPPD